MIRVSRCPCGSSSCHDWHVEGYATVQGVKFSENEARAVAYLLEQSDVVRRYAETHVGLECIQEVHHLRKQLSEANETIRDFMTPKTASNVLEAEYALTGNPDDRELLTAIRKHARAKGWD